MDGRKTVAASAVITIAKGDVLLIKRVNPPEAGRWTLPGGCVEAGETLEAAAIREVREETGLDVVVERELGQLNVPDANGGIYEIHDFMTKVVGGEPVAGDDAAEVGWFSQSELSKLDVTTDLLLYLNRYGVYAGDSSRGLIRHQAFNPDLDL